MNDAADVEGFEADLGSGHRSPVYPVFHSALYCMHCNEFTHITTKRNLINNNDFFFIWGFLKYS